MVAVIAVLVGSTGGSSGGCTAVAVGMGIDAGQKQRLCSGSSIGHEVRCKVVTVAASMVLVMM